MDMGVPGHVPFKSITHRPSFVQPTMNFTNMATASFELELE